VEEDQLGWKNFINGARGLKMGFKNILIRKGNNVK
jgi:hypothetical protein